MGLMIACKYKIRGANVNFLAMYIKYVHSYSKLLQVLVTVAMIIMTGFIAISLQFDVHLSIVYFLANDSCFNNSCDHICIAGNNSYTCQCNKTYFLAADNTSCVKCAQSQSRRINKIKPTWHVAICNASNEKTICSGTAISDQWVLTSAGCVCSDNFDQKHLSIRFAKTRTCFYNDPDELQLLASHIYCYPGYKPIKVAGDLALIKLQSPIPLHVIRQSPPLCLKTNKKIEKSFRFGKEVIIFGWGLVGEQVNQSDVLMSTGKVIISRKSECRVVFNSQNVKFRPPSEVICTVSNTSEACLGNYGSAVITQRGRYEVILGGVVSKKTKVCGTSGSYLAHSYTAHKDVIEWINSITQLIV